MKVWLANHSSEAIYSYDGEDIKDNIKTGHLVQNWHSHLHHHLHYDLKGFYFFEKDAKAKVAEKEGEGHSGNTLCVPPTAVVLFVRSMRKVFDKSRRRNTLTNQFEYVYFFVL
jgi:hypothetical protein